MHTDLLHLQRYHDSGDAGEFQALVRHHADMVFATARRVTRDAALAEDVAQETFLELARKGRSITDSVGAWLHRVAWRRACDMVRAEVTRQRYESAAHDLNQGRECTWEEIEPMVDEAISELPVEQRSVIIEHYLEGRTQAVLAVQLGVSQSTVSRLLDQSLTELRARLKQKGLLCGAGLAGMMVAASSSSLALPATLMASLQKIGLSSIGSGATAVTTAGAGAGAAWLGGFLGLNLKVAALAVVAVTACVAAYDLASERSVIMSWLGQTEPVQAVAVKAAPRSVATKSTEDPAAKKARLLAEARAFWDKRPQVAKSELQRLFSAVVYESDAEKRWAAMAALGIKLSRAEYDRIVARHPDVYLFDERKAVNAKGNLVSDILATWCRESPQEHIVWASTLRGGSPMHWFVPTIAPWVRSHPEEWAAFVEAGPDPKLGEYAQLWVNDLDDPGSIWDRAGSTDLKPELIDEAIFVFILSGAPVETLYPLIMRAPEARVRHKHIIGIATRLTDRQLLEAANSGLFSEPGLADTLRVMGGDPKANFDAAAAWFTKSANGGGTEAQQARWTEKAAGRFYAAWIKADARAALQHAVRAINKILLEEFMAACAASPRLTEKLIVESFTSPVNRERALAAYYQARAGGDPKLALQSIMKSSASADQIECAKGVLQQWTIRSPTAAAAWVAKLPTSDDRAELIGAVIGKWAETEPEAACAFAQEQGIVLGDEWYHGLSWGGRNLRDDKLATLLKPLRGDPKYNEMLTGLVGYRYPSHPTKAFDFLAQHGAPGWQTPMIDDIIHWLEGEDSREEDYAPMLPAMDLSKVATEKVTKAATLFVQSLVAQGKLQPALDWTLKLPAQYGGEARQHAIAKLPPDGAKQKVAAENWIRTAAISEAERTALLQQVNLVR